MLITQHPMKRGILAYVIHNLEVFGNTLLNWFNNNSMKANSGKYLLLSGNDSIEVTIRNQIISSSKCEKLLEIKIGSNRDFKEHIGFLCKKSNKKINAQCRLS